MIRPDQIPDEVVEAAAVAIAQWNDGDDEFRRLYRMDARLAIAAAIAAWPSGAVCHYTISDTEGWELVLPLPEAPQERISTENSDD